MMGNEITINKSWLKSRLTEFYFMGKNDGYESEFRKALEDTLKEWD